MSVKIYPELPRARVYDSNIAPAHPSVGDVWTRVEDGYSKLHWRTANAMSFPAPIDSPLSDAILPTSAAMLDTGEVQIVSGAGIIASLRDGLWSVYTGLAGTTIYVGYGGSRFIAMTSGGVIKYSDDLVNWTAAASNGGMTGANAAPIYINGVWVAACNAGIYNSVNNGANWTQLSAVTSVNMSAIVTDGTVAFASGNSGNIFLTYDGINFTKLTAWPSTNSLQTLAYGNGELLVGNGTSTMYNSIDLGASFQPNSNPPGSMSSSMQLAFDYTSGMMIAYSSSAAADTYYTKPNAASKTWTARLLPIATGGVMKIMRAFPIRRRVTAQWDGTSWQNI